MSILTILRGAAGLTALCLAAAAPAYAAQIDRDGDALVLRGVGTEANHLSVALDDFSSSRLRFTDRTSYAMTADPSLGCELTSSGFGHFASCPFAGIAQVRVEGGNGDDELDISAHDLPTELSLVLDGGEGNDDIAGPTNDRSVSLLGGPGNDLVKGGAGADRIDGGDGNDQVDGGDGNDEVRGGAGDDTVTGGRTLSADLIDGGPGRDTSKGDWYDANVPETGPVSVTFDGVANDGRPGEGDNVQSIEVIETKRVSTLIAGDGADGPVEFSVTNTSSGGSRLVGTPFADRLRTDSSDDSIEGGAGNDAIDAGYGNDVINPGPGSDTVLADGGAGACDIISCPLPQGNDTIQAADGETDSISCGPGTDTVVADPQDIVAGDCEVVQRTGGATSTPSPTPTPTPTPGANATVTLKVSAARLATALRRGLEVRVTGLTGTVRVTASRRGKLVARGSAKARGTRATVRLQFTRAAKRALRHERKVVLRIAAGGADRTVTVRR